MTPVTSRWAESFFLSSRRGHTRYWRDWSSDVCSSDLAAGTGARLRTVRWRRALGRTVWQYGRLRIAGPAIIAFEPAGYDELDPDDEPVRLKLLSTAVWRTRAVQGLDGAEVRAAPVGDRQWVITADGLHTVYGAGVVRGRS